MEAKKIFAGAIYFVWDKRIVLARALSIPFGLYLLLGIVSFWETPPLISWMYSFLAMGLHTVFAVTTHRIILLGADAVPTWGLGRWTMRESYFLYYSLLLGLLFIPVFIVFWIPVVGPFIGVAITFYVIFWVYPRLCLVFPGIAVNKAVDFRLSWQLTRKHHVLMALVILFFPIVFGIPSILVSWIPYFLIPQLILETLANVYTIAALSIAYREITSLEY